MDEKTAREKIVEEALSWRGTPWHHEARVKGGGVDCGMLLLEVFEKAGLIPRIEPAHYGPDFMLHRGDEWFALYVLKYADEVKEPPYLPGDVILFRHGRIFSHGGIIIDWPSIIHASAQEKAVNWGNVEQHPLSAQKWKVFRYRFERSES
jgi:cell wall-associated NlpC family hydrolase